MKAIRLHTPDGLDGLRLDEIDLPQVGPGEALLRVHAAAITRDELDWPVDRLPAIPSYEVSGVVEAVAADVAEVGEGDAVYALTPFDRDGAAAEYAVVPAALLARKPNTVDHVESAAIPLAALSAWQGLFDQGGLREGDRVLIHGASGGVGHFAAQLARWRGAHVIVTADEVGTEPVDLVFDTAGGERLAKSAAVVHTRGRIVSVAEEQPGVTYFVVEPRREQLVELTGLVDTGVVRPSIDSVFPLAEGRAAFERSIERGKRGKVVLRIAHD